MSIGPIKKTRDAGRIKKISYYYNRGYNKKFDEVLEKTKEEKEKQETEIELEKKQRDENRRNYESNEILYNAEASRTKNLKTYNRLNSKNPEDIIPEHKPNRKLQISKMQETYNRGKKENVQSMTQKNSQKELEKNTKKQEMKNFKKSLKPKSNLDIACEEFSRVLEERNNEKKRAERRGYLVEDYDKYR